MSLPSLEGLPVPCQGHSWWRAGHSEQEGSCGSHSPAHQWDLPCHSAGEDSEDA